jgi:pimeloyl-ACP methyl ester carboxylesterase
MGGANLSRALISVQNPTTSLEDDVAATKRAIKLAGGDVILLGHSWGGFVITEAGDDPHVKALVYVAAYAPDQGETVPSVTEKAPPTRLTNFVKSPHVAMLARPKEVLEVIRDAVQTVSK